MKPRRIDFYPADWLAGTIGLSVCERGLYITALMLIYSRGGPISTEQLRACCQREHGRTFTRLLRSLLDRGKLIQTEDGELDNYRCETELELARKRIEKATKLGAVGNEIKGLKSATRSLSSSPSPKKKEYIHTPAESVAEAASLRSAGVCVDSIDEGGTPARLVLHADQVLPRPARASQEQFKALRQAYPKRRGADGAFQVFCDTLRDNPELTPEALIEAADSYVEGERKRFGAGFDAKKLPQLGDWLRDREYEPEPEEEPEWRRTLRISESIHREPLEPPPPPRRPLTPDELVEHERMMAELRARFPVLVPPRKPSAWASPELPAWLEETPEELADFARRKAAAIASLRALDDVSP